MTVSSRLWWLWLATLAVVAVFTLAGAVVLMLTTMPPPAHFVTRSGADFMLNGAPYTFLGTNNYYLIYTSPKMVDDVLAKAKANHFSVVRTGAFMDIGSLDGVGNVDVAKDGVYFQYWNGTAPAYNDGADGLRRLDYVVYRAEQLGLRLVLIFTNNWMHFGGMDQYVRWRGGKYHDEFYSDPTIRQWFKDYIAHLITRKNTYSGRIYRDDPTILAWELANEPRCQGIAIYPASPDCAPATLTAWAAEMSAHVKSLDPNHLVGVGDEGTYCVTGSKEWWQDCSRGVDSYALAAVEAVDYKSFHLYAGQYGITAEWGTAFLERNVADRGTLNKPLLLGEFGYISHDGRETAYRSWLRTITASKVNGSLFWMLAGVRDDNSPYPDYDGFTIYCPSPICTLLSTTARQIGR